MGSDGPQTIQMEIRSMILQAHFSSLLPKQNVRSHHDQLTIEQSLTNDKLFELTQAVCQAQRLSRRVGAIFLDVWPLCWSEIVTVFPMEALSALFSSFYTCLNFKLLPDTRRSLLFNADHRIKTRRLQVQEPDKSQTQ